MSLSRSSFVLIATPGDRRVELFQSALHALGLPTAQLVSYQNLLDQRVTLQSVIQPGAIVRIESPGKSPEMERAFLKLGAELPDPDSVDYERHSLFELENAPLEKGRLWSSRQWYLGYSHFLRRLAPQLEGFRLMNQPDDILCMFDKRTCHERLSQHGIAVPESLPAVGGYAELLERMQQRGWRQVFLKPAHSSSASGIIAYRFSAQRHQAVTTIEVEGSGVNTRLRLYNTRKIHTYHDQHSIARLIDRLCKQRLHVERWLPKAGYDGKVFDLRIVVIAGQLRQTVVRLSKTPFTNLHLLNERTDLERVLPAIGGERWQAACRSCEQAAQVFEKSLYMGIDLLFTSDYRRHAILELNAFGDLLPGVLSWGQDTYTAEIQAALTPETVKTYAAHS